MTDHELGDVTQLLHQMGRSSTPPVPDSDFGITRLHLVFGSGNADATEILTVAGSALLERLRSVAPASAGIPGMLAEQAGQPSVVCLIIDELAFHQGPWLGAASGAYHRLAEDIFEAGRVVRARGGNVLYVPAPGLGVGADLPRIRSTATDVITEIPEDHFEENAPQSAVWQVCTDYAYDSTR